VTAVSDRGYNGAMAVRRILCQVVMLCSLSILPQMGADVPWPEVTRRLADENEKLARRPQGHDGEYFVVCTIYYTPMESGFTAERGFDVTLVTRPGLQGHKYPREFLRAVKNEGFGRIITPVNGRNYIRYDGNNSFEFAPHPIGRAGDLIPRSSAAARSRQPGFSSNAELITASDAVRDVFGGTNWRIADLGGGLRRWQIDLYWGEDEPMGPGKLLARPRRTEFEYAYSEAKLKESTKAN
jgi:hypothetical protein